MAVRGRLYRVVLDCTYAGGTLVADTADVIQRAVHAETDGFEDVSFSVVADHHSIVRVAATVREGNAVTAIGVVNDSLDRALAVTGLLEEFDITGKVIHIAPLEQAHLLGLAANKDRR